MDYSFIGVDPGKTGYICVLKPNGEALFIANDKEPIRIYNAVNDYRLSHPVRMIMIEDVHAIQGTSAKSNFSFGFNTGCLTGVLSCTKIGIDLAKPKEWQKAVGIKLPTAKLKGTARQRAIKQAVADKCKSLYPSVNLYGVRGGLQHGKSDALMLAHYCLLKYK